MLASVLLRQSSLLAELLASQRWLFEQGIAVHDPRVLDRLKQDILDEPDGQFFFAHVLLPHAPFTYLHDCSISYEAGYRLRYPTFKDEHGLDKSVFEIRSGLYYEQMECALVSLRRIFDDMKKTGIFERSIVVIHGDHGSMIAEYLPRRWNIEHLTPEHYRAQFSTLFAVKFPYAEFQVDKRTLPLGALMEGFSKTLQGYVMGERSPKAFSRSIPTDPVKVDPYIYLLGSYPMQRIDISLFED